MAFLRVLLLILLASWPALPRAQEATFRGRVPAVVQAEAVRLRDLPSTSARIVGRLVRGERVMVLEGRANGWYLVQRGTDIAFAFGQFLHLEQAPAAAVAPAPPQAAPARAAPIAAPTPAPTAPERTHGRLKPSDSLIAWRIIAESIARYPGNCPCPYNTDRAGRRCGVDIPVM